MHSINSGRSEVGGFCTTYSLPLQGFEVTCPIFEISMTLRTRLPNAFHHLLVKHNLWPPYVIGQAIYIFILWFLLASLWPPYVIEQAIHIFILWFVFSFFLFFSPNLSGRRLDVYHTSTHGVALLQI